MEDPLTATYPTNSLNFLKRLRGEDVGIDPPAQNPSSREQNEIRNDNINTNTTPNNHKPPKTPLKLNILIIGAGLGGLATSIALSRHPHHKITILESSPTLTELGAGIQIPPNSLRLLLSWGLGPLLSPKAVRPTGMTLRRWADGRPIGLTRLVPNHEHRYGAGYWVVHRADLHAAMVDCARAAGVTIRTGCAVVAYDDAPGQRPSATTRDGETLIADLVVAADGVKSLARSYVVPSGRDVKPTTTPFAAYRATVETSRMLADPDTAWLVEPGKPSLNLWIGEGRHVMSYTIAGGSAFNMVLSHTDTSDASTWPTEPGECLAQLKRYYADWDPALVKVIDLIDARRLGRKWPLLTVGTSAAWLSASRRLLILGDAAHGMLPYMSQGAAMAVEDGAALAEALAFVDADAADSQGRIVEVLEAWQRVRVRRAGQMQRASAVNGVLWHFADGVEQRARDESMRGELGEGEIEESANQWSDPRTANWAYGYDACEEMRRELKQSCDR